MSGDKNYLKLLDDMRELHIKKNAGYSGDSQDRWANFRMSESFGVSAVLGCLVRMSDKFIRIQNLIKNPKNEQVGETITDTLMDLASYALITICLLNEGKSSRQYEERVLVKISRASTKDWYGHIVDPHFVVREIEKLPEYYQVIEGEYSDNLISKKDCVVING
jgi:hypothetical protein